MAVCSLEERGEVPGGCVCSAVSRSAREFVYGAIRAIEGGDVPALALAGSDSSGSGPLYYNAHFRNIFQIDVYSLQKKRSYPLLAHVVEKMLERERGRFKGVRIEIRICVITEKYWEAAVDLVDYLLSLIGGTRQYKAREIYLDGSGRECQEGEAEESAVLVFRGEEVMYRHSTIDLWS
jgi:hypothetical protein